MGTTAPPPPGSGAAPHPVAVASADGLALAAETWASAAAPPRTRVHVVHGFGEHRGRYQELARELRAAGHAVHLFDLRGHGASGGRRGHVPRFADYRDDLLRVADAVAPAPPAEEGRAPAILVGHSLGGLIALDTVLHHPGRFDALALSSPYLAPAFRIPFYAPALAWLAALLLPRATFDAGLDPKGLSHDPEEVRRYAEDPLVVRRITGSWFLEVTRAQGRVRARPGEVRLPLLLLLGSADPVAAPDPSRALFDRLGSREKRLEVYDGFYHEVFKELGRERVVADLLGWLDARAAGASA